MGIPCQNQVFVDVNVVEFIGCQLKNCQGKKKGLMLQITNHKP
jgi:hypothetical protein